MGPRKGAQRAGIVDADHLDAVESVRVVDEDPPALGEDRVVGGVPRHGQGLRDPRNREVLDHQRFQRPAQRAAGQPRPRFRGAAGVLSPDVAAAAALVAAHRDQQRRRAPAQRLVRQPPGHRVPRAALATTAPAPLVGLDDAAGQHRTVRLEALAEDLQAKLVQAAERGQVGAGEGSVRHVEVFLDGLCENSHPREASTPTRAPTRRPLHPQMR